MKRYFSPIRQHGQPAATVAQHRSIGDRPAGIRTLYLPVVDGQREVITRQPSANFAPRLVKKGGN